MVNRSKVIMIKPMLAGKATDDALQELFSKGPLLASPKLDGVRGLVLEGQLVSRSLKPIRNKHTQRLFGKPELNGLDGELIVGRPNARDVYRKTNSAVMSIGGEPYIRFLVFDRFTDHTLPFRERRKRMRSTAALHICTSPLKQTTVVDMEGLNLFEQKVLASGYEGVMIRRSDAPYKFGRSTAKEGFLLKLKRFSDGEAEVIGVIEEMHNSNEAVINSLGLTERSSHRGHMAGKGTLGALLVRDTCTGKQFKIGTGFTASDRAGFWDAGSRILGRVAKYKFFEIGVKDLPRHPVFMGWRDRDDMSL